MRIVYNIIATWVIPLGACTKDRTNRPHLMGMTVAMESVSALITVMPTLPPDREPIVAPNFFDGS